MCGSEPAFGLNDPDRKDDVGRLCRGRIADSERPYRDQRRDAQREGTAQVGRPRCSSRAPARHRPRHACANRIRKLEHAGEALGGFAIQCSEDERIDLGRERLIWAAMGARRLELCELQLIGDVLPGLAGHV
ncbi:hypothetical protein OV079_49270 [Nannocystis pusilla]|uniref:Uncharacterized protein n=1 Tax=Nannocystis pusilla TaxID=889268 RepID=A0A9X3J361_9BACT|nr:hypothetical protein [Nannocystis pusilla]MCY1013391.1 hypothetical protein [Nannocystis pusilla]